MEDIMISSRKIREKFLKFFENNNHLVINGSSVIPKNDPTLLYINAGMAAIKNYFTGDESPEKPELCNVQNCIRTIDIDDIGDHYHLTSFQMLGSWSIGSYFKEKAISLAFDFLTNYLEIPISKLYVSVFSGNPDIGLEFDNESKKSWIKCGIPEDHVVSFGMEDNFWGPAAETGPCGPCTEVFYDTGLGTEYIPGKFFDTRRYVEIWNAGVFMMLNKNSDGSFGKLPFKSVDTGAGLERLSMVLNGLSSVYDTDLLSPIKNKIESNFEFENENEKKIRILTDHLRTICLILSEKQKISNEGRGYIPRKLIRKCVVIASKNEKKSDCDLVGIVEFILDNFKDMNENFSKNRDYIISEFSSEQEKFKHVIETGFDKIKSLKSKNISGKFLFELVTTFGMPMDVIKDYASENSISIDEQEFEKLMENHKKISRSDSNSSCEMNEIFEKLGDIQKTEFVGYDNLKSKSKVLKIFSENLCELDSSEGENVILVLDSTPIYSKGGGQESDSGKIFTDEFSADVNFALKKDGVVVHYCDSAKGKIRVGDMVNIEVDSKKREGMSNAHSATHLLQSALRQIFGPDVHQQGSKVQENCLHFDFNCNEKIDRSIICELEKIVNQNIRSNFESNIRVMPLSDAVKQGATAIFSEKYGDLVRVVSFGGVSKELCGGTHVKRTGQIGTFLITSCESIGKGVKRINALTSEKALDYIQRVIEISNQSCEILHTKLENLPNVISSKLDSGKKCSYEKINKSDLKFLDSKIPFAYYIYKNKVQAGDIKKIANEISGIFLAISADGSKIFLSTGKNSGLNSKKILEESLKDLGGKGGGNSGLASGGILNKTCEEVVAYFRDNSF